MSDNLIQFARSGNRDALAALLKRHDATVRAAVDAGFPQRWRAQLTTDDVLQVTYTDAFMGIAEFQADNEAAFVAWLKRIALNNLHDAIRRLEAVKRNGDARYSAAAGPNATPSLLDAVQGGDSATPSRILMQAEAEQALRAALASLPPDHRRAVQLYDLERRTIEDVAREMARSPGAVHLLRVRAHDRLRQVLAAHASISQVRA